MRTNNRKSRFLLITALSSALMTSGIAMAEEAELMVASPELAFSLQAKVQHALELQIEEDASAMLIDHQIEQEFQQMPAVSTDCTEKKRGPEITCRNFHP